MRKALVSLLVVLSLVVTVSAHSGRTDSSGGHKDNKNVSGLGSYHYHCGGYPAHLHTRGYCPYKDTFPTSVKVSAEKTTLIIGEKTTLTGNVSPADACNTDVSWKSSDSSVISIKNGAATAVGLGTATITATTFNGKEGQITIKVTEILAERIELKCDGPLTVGETGKISAAIFPENAADQRITWSVSDEKIATIDKNGNIVAHTAGEVVIKATQKDTSAEITLQIVAKPTELPTEAPTENPTETPTEELIERPAEGPSIPDTQKPAKDTETDFTEVKGSALPGLIVFAGIVGLAIFIRRKIRPGMKVGMIICFVFTGIYSLMAIVAPIILFMTFFCAILGVMFLLLGISPRESKYMFGKTNGMRKRLFVFLCILCAYLVAGITMVLMAL